MLATEKAFGKSMYFTLDRIFTLLFTSLLTFKAMSCTLFLEFYPLTKFAGNIRSLKIVKIFTYQSKFIFYT